MRALPIARFQSLAAMIPARQRNAHAGEPNCCVPRLHARNVGEPFARKSTRRRCPIVHRCPMMSGKVNGLLDTTDSGRANAPVEVLWRSVRGWSPTRLSASARPELRLRKPRHRCWHDMQNCRGVGTEDFRVESQAGIVRGVQWRVGQETRAGLATIASPSNGAGAVIGRETRVLLWRYLEQGLSKAAVARVSTPASDGRFQEVQPSPVPGQALPAVACPMSLESVSIPR